MGQNPSCDQIEKRIASDALQIQFLIQFLQQQEASTNNPATIAQLNTQITGLEQDQATLEQLAQSLACPTLTTNEAR
ncbi:MAG TPA: hypothetical protein VFA10_30775 [Ktedonobacteraceae bacterium]|nr:hypothetical protein [Ktedonobacteraceae bacterium]